MQIVKDSLRAWCMVGVKSVTKLRVIECWSKKAARKRPVCALSAWSCRQRISNW